MDKNRRVIQDCCDFAGLVSLVIYFILTLIGSSTALLALCILFLGIAAIVYAVKMVVVESRGVYAVSVIFILFCLLNIAVTAMQLQ